MDKTDNFLPQHLKVYIKGTCFSKKKKRKKKMMNIVKDDAFDFYSRTTSVLNDKTRQDWGGPTTRNWCLFLFFVCV